MTLTKADMAEMLFDQVGLNKREAKDMVEAFFEEIRLALESGDVVKLSGFGNFELRKNLSAQAAIQKLVKKYQSQPAVL